jgi:hypothetical protein
LLPQEWLGAGHVQFLEGKMSFVGMSIPTLPEIKGWAQKAGTSLAKPGEHKKYSQYWPLLICSK